jgi:hypothetical protein
VLLLLGLLHAAVCVSAQTLNDVLAGLYNQNVRILCTNPDWVGTPPLYLGTRYFWSANTAAGFIPVDSDETAA